jgi:hypothetical protein
MYGKATYRDLPGAGTYVCDIKLRAVLPQNEIDWINAEIGNLDNESRLVTGTKLGRWRSN